MKVLFRTDVSIQIGTGHMMRCLTLAKTLRSNGTECFFVCRKYPGHLMDIIREAGFEVITLKYLEEPLKTSNKNIDSKLSYRKCSKTFWQIDAEETISALAGKEVDWIIIDHYSLDNRWGLQVRPFTKKIMVIDDLANRKYECDLLLDQNLVANPENRYKNLVSTNCLLLIGPTYALVRPEFNQLRVKSLERRAEPELNRLLVFLGGSDAENETKKVLEGIRVSNTKWQHIDVIVGLNHPAIKDLKKILVEFSSAELHIQTSYMGQLMMQADLAITAGGSVTWEKCTLGLPSLVAISGANQFPIANRMDELGVQRTLGSTADLTPANYGQHLSRIQPADLKEMAFSAQSICDGLGIYSVLNAMRIFE